MDGFTSDIDEIINICLKETRTERETIALEKYLSTLHHFMSLVKETATSKSSVAEIVRLTCQNLILTFLERDNLFFRFGEKGENFYIILKGSVSVLLPRLEKAFMSEEEYLRYLLNLRLYNEIEILNKCLMLNKVIFHFSEKDEFDEFICLKMQEKQEMVETNEFPLSNNNNKNCCFFSSLSKLTQKLFKEVHTLILAEGNAAINNRISANDYIKRLKPLKSSRLSSFKSIFSKFIESVSINVTIPKSIVNIYNYTVINTIKTGEMFGEIALNSRNGTRSATIITEEDTYLGSLTKDSYELFFKDLNNKSKKNLFSIVLAHEIFKEVNKTSFERKFFNLFKLKKFSRGESIVNENEMSEYIYFIKSGEYETTSKRSIYGLKEIITQYQKYLNKDLVIDEQTLQMLLTQDVAIYKYYDNAYKKYFLDKKNLKLFITQNNGIFGLDDYINKKRKPIKTEHFFSDNNLIGASKFEYLSNFTVTCVSNQGEAYMIKREMFAYICSKERHIRDNLKTFLNTKINFMLDRVLHYMKLQIDNYKNKISLPMLSIPNIEKSALINPNQTSTYSINTSTPKNIKRYCVNKSTAKMTLQLETSEEKNYCLTERGELTDYYPTKNNTTKLKTKINFPVLNKVSAFQNTPLKTQDDFVSPGKDLFVERIKKNVIKSNLFNNVFQNYHLTSREGPSCSKLSIGLNNNKVATKKSVNKIDMLLMDKFKEIYSKSIKGLK